MLEVLTGSGVTNAAVVVTRYFGGTLLGTGGLVRAYRQAVKAGLDYSELGIVTEGLELEVIADYNDAEKIRYLLEQKGIKPENTEYAADVTLQLHVALEAADNIEKELTEATAGRCLITRGNPCEILTPSN